MTAESGPDGLGGKHKQDRRSHACRDQTDHGLVEVIRHAEIAMGDMPKINRKLHKKRLVEAIRCADSGQHLGRSSTHGAGDRLGRIPRYRMDQKKVENEHSDKQDDSVNQPSGDIGGQSHVAPVLRVWLIRPQPRDWSSSVNRVWRSRSSLRRTCIVTNSESGP